MRVTAMVIGILGSVFGFLIGLLVIRASTGPFADGPVRSEGIAIMLLFSLGFVSAALAWRIPRQAGWTMLGVTLAILLLAIIPPAHGVAILAVPIAVAGLFAVFARRRIAPLSAPYPAYAPAPGGPMSPVAIVTPARKTERIVLFGLSAVMGIAALGFGIMSATMRAGDTDSVKVARLQQDFQATAVARRGVGDDSVASLYRTITYMSPAEAGVVDVHTSLGTFDNVQAVLLQVQLLLVAVDENDRPPLKYRIYEISGAVLKQP